MNGYGLKFYEKMESVTTLIGFLTSTKDIYMYRYNIIQSKMQYLFIVLYFIHIHFVQKLCNFLNMEKMDYIDLSPKRKGNKIKWIRRKMS